MQVEALITNGEGTILNEPQAGDLVKVREQHAQRSLRRPVHADRGVLALQQHLGSAPPSTPCPNQIVVGEASPSRPLSASRTS